MSRTFAEFTEKHELPSIESFCPPDVLCWHCGSILVCYTRGSGFEYSFVAKIFFKFYRFCRIHLGKTPLDPGLWPHFVHLTPLRCVIFGAR